MINMKIEITELGLRKAKQIKLSKEIEHIPDLIVKRMQMTKLDKIAERLEKALF